MILYNYGYFSTKISISQCILLLIIGFTFIGIIHFISINQYYDYHEKIQYIKGGQIYSNGKDNNSINRHRHPVIVGGRSKNEPKMDPPMITIFSHGARLGNQMCAYATLYSIGKSNNRTVCMSPELSSFISKYFKTTMCILSNEIYERIKWTLKKDIANYNDACVSSITNVTTRYIKYTGYPYSWKYYDHFRSFILEEFQCHDNIIQISKNKITEAIKKFPGSKINKKIIIGIHVRGGDYGLNAKELKIHMPTKEYYMGSMNYFKNKYKDVVFIVGSNDIPWCEYNFSPLNNNSIEYQFKIYYLRGTSEENGGLDLAVLSKCNHSIFGVGTFGYWSGYLTGGEVIFCSDCIRHDSVWFSEYQDYANFVLPTWIEYSRNGTRSSVLPKLEQNKTKC